MKIALLGGTGKTGSEFLKIALDDNHRVKALIRDASKLKISHTNLDMIEGDVLNIEDVEQLVGDCDAVVSLFGHVKNSPEWLQTEGTQNLASAMKKHGVSRIISLSGGGLPFPEKDEPKFIDKAIRFIMKLTVPKILNDAQRHAEVLKDSGLNWSIVRGPRLTDDAPKGKYNVGWVGTSGSTKISRADLAGFILEELKNEKFRHQMPFVTN